MNIKQPEEIESIVVHVATLEQYDKLMHELEERGYLWASMEKPCFTGYQELYPQYASEGIGIRLRANRITYTGMDFYHKQGYKKIISFNEFMGIELIETNLNRKLISAIKLCQKIKQ